MGRLILASAVIILVVKVGGFFPLWRGLNGGGGLGIGDCFAVCGDAGGEDARVTTLTEVVTVLGGRVIGG